MNKCLQILLRAPWEDCSGVVSWMKSKAHRLTACEHEADEDVKTTHVHISIEPKVSKEGIRQQLIKNSLGGEKYAILEKVIKTKELYDFRELSKYCIKGDRQTLRETTLSQEEVEILEKLWVNRAKKFDHDLTAAAPLANSGEHRSGEPKVRGEWEKLLSEHRKHTNYLTMNMADIKRFIKSFYLKQAKPIPRDGDARRYAYSLWALAQQKTDELGVREADGHEQIHMT